MTAVFKPKYISFDCYGTLTNFQMAPSARRLFADRIRPEQMDGFCRISPPTGSTRYWATGNHTTTWFSTR